MKILASYDGAASGYVRMLLPLRELAKHGHDVTFINHHAKTSGGVIGQTAVDALKMAGNYDVVVGQRFAGYDGMTLWRRARTPSNRLVYETDDDLFSIDKANWGAYTLFGKLDIQEALKGYSITADLVTVTVETLAQVQRDIGCPNVAVLPNCIPEYVLELPRTERARPRIGWMGGGSHGVDIHEATIAVRRFLNSNDAWDLYLRGTDYRPSFKANNWDQMLYEDWLQINDNEYEYYQSLDFDIGIAPVRDTKFSRSKSALKPLEYNARGIPVIASDVQPYKEYVVHGENGFLAKNEHEWLRYLRLLANDADLRHEMGMKGKQHAAEFTVEGNWQRWEKAYTDLFGVKSA